MPHDHQIVKEGCVLDLMHHGRLERVTICVGKLDGVGMESWRLAKLEFMMSYNFDELSYFGYLWLGTELTKVRPCLVHPN
jgi:hypothetical protein